MKKLLNIFLIVLSLLVVTSAVYAQTAPAAPVDEVSDLTFPISDLGSCVDYSSCMTYCEDPVNHASCIEYAKQKGFYKDDPVLAPTQELWNDAQGALGCNSDDSCLETCSQPANFDKCDQFAKASGAVGGYVEQPDKPEYLEKAKEVLGCDSAQSCSTFCDDSANADKCDKFASQVGLLGGNTPEGPGGCTTEGTCQLYCSDPSNFGQCSSFVPEGGTFTGPGGCTSPESCRNFCEENPENCRSYSPGANGVYTPATCPQGEYFGPGGVCTSNTETTLASACAQGGKYWDGSACQDNAPEGIDSTVGGAFFQPRPEMNNCTTPGECYDFCKENPDKCPSFDANSEKPKDDYIPSLYYTPGTDVKFEPKADMGNCDSPGACYDYCSENPTSCQGFDTKSPRPLDVYTPLTYYTPPSDATYFTPPATSFYVTPIYYTPPAGSTYSTPSYYTPGQYSTPSYYTPPTGSNYTSPSYYSPGNYYPSPVGNYPTPNYVTPTYYTPPVGSNYTSPSYYTPHTYTTPNYYTPSDGRYTTPTYITPPTYTTPQYYTPYTGGPYSTPIYFTPFDNKYTTPNYPTPNYPTPFNGYPYPSPRTYPSPDDWVISYYSPSRPYYTPGTPYSSPNAYPTPGGYPSPSGNPSYPSPSQPNITPYYNYPTPGGYPTPDYVYPSPSGSGVSYYTPNSSYTYPSPTDGYSTPGPWNPYSTPPGDGSGTPYSTPTYGSPSYSSPPTDYSSPSYNSPPSEYSSPSYSSPPEGATQGVSTNRGLLQMFLDLIR